MKKDTKFL